MNIVWSWLRLGGASPEGFAVSQNQALLPLIRPAEEVEDGWIGMLLYPDQVVDEIMSRSRFEPDVAAVGPFIRMARFADSWWLALPDDHFETESRLLFEITREGGELYLDTVSAPNSVYSPDELFVLATSHRHKFDRFKRRRCAKEPSTLDCKPHNCPGICTEFQTIDGDEILVRCACIT